MKLNQIIAILSTPIIIVCANSHAQSKPYDIQAAINKLTQENPGGEWQCEALLCLANPNGPKAVPQCVAPIDRLWFEISRGHPFPRCKSAEAEGSFARLNSNFYDICPDGLAELAQGTFAVRKADYSKLKMSRSIYTPAIESVPYFVGIGDGKNVSDNSINYRESNQSLPLKTCVAGSAGTAEFTIGINDDKSAITAQLYKTIVTVMPFATSSVIDVYIDNKLVRRVPIGGR